MELDSKRLFDLLSLNTRALWSEVDSCLKFSWEIFWTCWVVFHHLQNWAWIGLAKMLPRIYIAPKPMKILKLVFFSLTWISLSQHTYKHIICFSKNGSAFGQKAAQIVFIWSPVLNSWLLSTLLSPHLPA